jgi:hypothetical protein
MSWADVSPFHAQSLHRSIMPAVHRLIAVPATSGLAELCWAARLLASCADSWAGRAPSVCLAQQCSRKQGNTTQLSDSSSDWRIQVNATCNACACHAQSLSACQKGQAACVAAATAAVHDSPLNTTSTAVAHNKGAQQLSFATLVHCRERAAAPAGDDTASHQL